MPAWIEINTSDHKRHPVLLMLDNTLKKVLGRCIGRNFVDLQQIGTI